MFGSAELYDLAERVTVLCRSDLGEAQDATGYRREGDVRIAELAVGLPRPHLLAVKRNTKRIGARAPADELQLDFAERDGFVEAILDPRGSGGAVADPMREFVVVNRLARIRLA